MAAETETGWVLLAEDDHALRTLLSSLLRKDGHRVIATADGDELVLAHAGTAARARRPHGGGE